MTTPSLSESKSTLARPSQRRRWYRVLYIQVLIAVAIGIAIGYFSPGLGKSLKPLGDGFIKLVRMIIAPIIFCTVVHGIASLRDGRKLGRLGLKTFLYFEVVSTFALLIGLVVVNVWKPGVGMHIDPLSLDPSIGKAYAEKGHAQTTVDFLLNIIPKSFFDAFATGDILQVLLISILSAFAISFMGESGKPILTALARGEKVFFGIMHIIVKVAPIAALGAMGYTVGSHGVKALGPLLSLMIGFYLTAAIFVVVVLGLIARLAGFSIFRFINYIREELLLVFGTSSSETALPGLLEKLRRLGCAESTVGFVVPTGYSFNLDGTNIYMTMAAVFLAQATDTPLSLGHQITLLLVAMISSKGATGITGAGFIALAATLAAVHVLLTFTVSGLWHGANWTFVVWGFLNGLYFLPGLVRRYWTKQEPKSMRSVPTAGDFLPILGTFHLTLLAWIFFRSDSLTHVADVLNSIVKDFDVRFFLGDALKLKAFIFIMVALEWSQRHREHPFAIEHISVGWRWAIYNTALLAIVLLGTFKYSPFIYFQF